MLAEIICVGTELLLGEVVNTNAAFLARELATLGIPCRHQQVVGDNPARLQEALALALSRADLVLTSGGLGPTKDDLTKQTIAQALGLELEFDQVSWDHLVARLAARGREPEPSHRREAMMPVGAVVFPNPQGTANAIAVEVPLGAQGPMARRSPLGAQVVIMLPGPPRELTAVFAEQVAPYLQAKTGGALVSHDVKFFGIGESQLEAMLPDELLAGANPSAALYAESGQVRLRLAARADSKAEAEALLAPLLAQVQARVGAYSYGIDTDLATALVTALTEQRLTIATAESCTGGRVAAAITGVSGSSEVFGYGVVSYANSAKQELLGVREDTLARSGAVSPETAIEMARGVRSLADSDIGLGITGIAGPTGGSAEKPVGLVWVGVSSELGTEAHELRLDRGLADQRSLIQEHATNNALHLALGEVQRLAERADG